MMKMVNKQRVRRIKNLIYAFIILIFFLPLIFMSVLSIRMIGLANKMSDKLDELKMTVSQQASPPSQDSGYVIEPEGQSAKNGSEAPRTTEEKKPENASNTTPTASGEQPEASGDSSGSVTSNVEGVASNGSPGINGTQPGTLNSGVGGTVGEALDNPQSGGGVSSDQGYNSNPLTGR